MTCSHLLVNVLCLVLDAQSQAAGQQRPLLYEVGDTFDNITYIQQANELGAERILIVYEDYEGAHPSGVSTGEIDVRSLLSHIQQVSGGTPPKWGLLDFENPFMTWIENGPGNDNWVQATTQMVKAIRAVKASYPDTKWSFYQLPYVRYYIGCPEDCKCWSQASPAVRTQARARYLEQCAPVLAECQWICPSMYGFYDPAKYPPEDGARWRAATSAWCREQVALAVSVANGRPVVPIICPIWQPGGKARLGEPIPKAIFEDDFVKPGIEAGAAGFVVWTQFPYYIQCAIKDKVADPPQINRQLFIDCYLGGVSPRNWDDPNLANTLRRKSAEVVLNALTSVRAVESRPAP